MSPVLDATTCDCDNIEKYTRNLIESLTASKMDSRRKRAFKHAHKRALERYGIRLSLHSWNNLNTLILTGKSFKVHQPKRKNISIREVIDENNVRWKVCFSKAIGCIITFLPRTIK